MWSFISSSLSGRREQKRSLRKEERFPTNLLSTNLGEVLDISGSGVRIRCDGRTGLSVNQVVPLTIKSPQCKVVVQSRVVRVGRGREISFAFLDAKPALRAAIAHLGRFGFIPRLDYSGAGSGTASPAGSAPRRRRSMPDYYGVLGIAPAASADEIRRAYHALARQHHPDHSRNVQSVGVFESLVEAYQVLRDPSRRAAYDSARAADARDAA